MKNLLKLEELAQFAFCLSALVLLETPWWTYPLLLVGPDISMLGYLVNTRIGAVSYNLFHHKLIALLFVALEVVLNHFNTPTGGVDLGPPWYFIVGVLLYGHSCLDRIFGYGLKFGDSFQHTHLGWIGKAQGTGKDRSKV